jgi:HlyD family secretion protein
VTRGFWAVVAIGGAAVAAAVVLAQRRATEPPPAAPSAAIAAVERRDIDVVAEAAGVIEPIRVVEVKSKAAGEVLRVHVETGQRVEAGALLAEIDPRDVKSAYDQAVADLDAARVHLRVAESEQRRIEQMRESGLATPQQLDAAMQTTADARAALVRAETTLRLARERLEDVTIRAPLAGTIIERTVEPGQIIASATQNVSGGTTLFRMADLSSMQVRAKVDEVDIGQVHPGQRVQVTVDAFPGRTFTGEVAKVEPLAVVEQNVTLFPVLVRLGNPDDLLRPGMNADVSIEIARRDDVVAVPNAATVALRDARAAAAALGVDLGPLRASLAPARDGAAGTNGEEAPGEEAPAAPSAGGPRTAVVFVDAPGGPEARMVRLGLRDWEWTEVVSGLEPGEEVVLVSVAQLQRQQQQAEQRFRERMGGPMRTGTSSRRDGGG